MFPVILHPTKTRILVIGNGAATKRRIELLQAAGMEFIHYKTKEEWDKKEGQKADPAMSKRSGAQLQSQEALQGGAKQIIFIADFDEATSSLLYSDAKKANCLVNVEDKTEYCDFHVPAIVRRGDLLLTVSTNAASPRLARRIRMKLEQLFDESWAERLNQIRKLREEWKAQGASFQQLADNTDALLEKEGWLEGEAKK